MSAKRVQQFLQLEEMDWSHYYLGYHSGTTESRLLMCSTQPLHELSNLKSIIHGNTMYVCIAH